MAVANDQVFKEFFAREEAEYQVAIDAAAYEGTVTPPAELSLCMRPSGASQVPASASAAYSQGKPRHTIRLQAIPV